MRSSLVVAIGILAVLVMSSCGPTVRRSGQIEMFTIDDGAQGTIVLPPRRAYTSQEVTPDQARLGPNARVDPELGDLVRFTTDSVTITVPSVYLDHLPMTLSSATTGRYDAMLFAEVWENAAMDRTEPSINRIVHVALDQPIPGRLNFQDAIAYGPTTFKGHPLRIKFTLVLLQRRAKESGDTAAKSLQDFIAMAGAGTPAAAGASTVVALIRQVMRSLPDVEAFDFEATLIPFNPPTVLEVARSEAEKRVSESMIAVQKNPDDKARAQALGENLLAIVDRFQQTSDELVTVPIKTAQAEAAKKGNNQSSVLASIDRIRLDGLPAANAEAIEKAREEIHTLASTQKTIPEKELISKLDELSMVADQATAARRAQEFQNVRKGANELKDAKDAEDVTKAMSTIRSCSDYWRIAGRSTVVATTPSAINARPWFRYSMYALVETAHYRSGGAPPTIFEMTDASFANERLKLAKKDPARTSGTAPNWMLMDVLPGLQPVDDRILRAASDAAGRMFELTGFVPSQRLIENPSQLTTHFNVIRDDTFETLLQVRAERLAMDLARKHRRELDTFGTTGGPKVAPVSPFKEGGGKFNEEFDKLVGTLDVPAKSEARWNAVGDRVRRQFERRFE